MAQGEGNLAPLVAYSVSMVGARTATGYGEHVAGEMAFALAGRTITVVARKCGRQFRRISVLACSASCRALPRSRARDWSRPRHPGCQRAPCGEAPWIALDPAAKLWDMGHPEKLTLRRPHPIQLMQGLLMIE